MTYKDLQSGMLLYTEDDNLHLVLGNTAILLSNNDGGGILLHNLSFTREQGPKYNVLAVYSVPTDHLSAPMSWWIQDNRLLDETNSEVIWEYSGETIKKSDSIYPLLMTHEPSGLIVEFTDLSTGTVIVQGNGQFEVGHTSTNWLEHTDSLWTPVIVKEETSEFQYPIYCKHESSGLVVCFTSLKTGTVIVGDARNLYKVGHTSDTWLSHTNKWWTQINKPAETPTFEYPIYRKLEHEDQYIVVKFTALQTGTVTHTTVPDKYPVGYSSTIWLPHTNAEWEEYTVNHKTQATAFEEMLQEVANELGITIVMVSDHEQA